MGARTQSERHARLAPALLLLAGVLAAAPAPRSQGGVTLVRIEGPQGIVTGRSDLWEPVEADAPFDENWDYEKSPNLQDVRLERWLARDSLMPVVESVDADEFGGAAIRFGEGFVLRLFPAGTRGEDWRLLPPNTGDPHLVIRGGAVEPDVEPGA